MFVSGFQHAKIKFQIRLPHTKNIDLHSESNIVFVLYFTWEVSYYFQVSNVHIIYLFSCAISFLVLFQFYWISVNNFSNLILTTFLEYYNCMTTKDNLCINIYSRQNLRTHPLFIDVWRILHIPQRPYCSVPYKAINLINR